MPDVVLAVGTSTSPEKYQSKTSATPSFESATYPSRDIDMIATTLVMCSSFPRRGACVAAASVASCWCFRRDSPAEVIGARQLTVAAKAEGFSHECAWMCCDC